MSMSDEVPAAPHITHVNTASHACTTGSSLTLKAHSPHMSRCTHTAQPLQQHSSTHAPRDCTSEVAHKVSLADQATSCESRATAHQASKLTYTVLHSTEPLKHTTQPHTDRVHIT
mmetsp:Transcript_19973/g.49816  ORF Transcript_19973/g.49816 Transcript_19973/m.49816 type:complete len:115 (+) Transcript_19973:772-1116(+)